MTNIEVVDSPHAPLSNENDSNNKNNSQHKTELTGWKTVCAEGYCSYLYIIYIMLIHFPYQYIAQIYHKICAPYPTLTLHTWLINMIVSISFQNHGH